MKFKLLFSYRFLLFILVVQHDAIKKRFIIDVKDFLHGCQLGDSYIICAAFYLGIYTA